MTTLQNRPNTALLVVDVQTGVVAGAHERDNVVANMGALVDRARAGGARRLGPAHQRGAAREATRGSTCRALAGRQRAAGAQALRRQLRGHALESVLADLRVGRLVVVGAQTDACMRSTLHGAFVRGYDATLVSDAHTTEDLTP